MRTVPPEDAEAPGPSWKRLVWFLAIAAGSAVAAAIVAYGLRALLTF